MYLFSRVVGAVFKGGLPVMEKYTLYMIVKESMTLLFSHNGLTFLIVKYIMDTKNKSKDKDVLRMNIMPLLFFYSFIFSCLHCVSRTPVLKYGVSGFWQSEIQKI